jgi:hypothetical protein
MGWGNPGIDQIYHDQKTHTKKGWTVNGVSNNVINIKRIDCPLFNTYLHRDTTHNKSSTQGCFNELYQ